MLSRREFVAGTGASLSAPFLLKARASAQTLRMRRDVMEMADDDPFFSNYAKAVRAMHALPETDGRNWRRQAKIHADFCHHGSIEFLHWHRHYITFFERICSELSGDPEFTLPYWNWSKRSGRIPAPFFNLADLNVESWNDPGVYSSSNWGPVNSIARRGLDETHGLLDDPVRGGPFTTDTIDGIKRLTAANLFQRRLEGSPHNSGHVISGALPSGETGHIGDGLSPLDPIFWLHHCMVDRIWAEWQKAGNQTPDPKNDYKENFFDASGAPALAGTTSAMQISALGYTYDVLEQTNPPVAAPLANVFDAIAPDALQRGLDASEPRSLGASEADERSTVMIETPIDVSVPGLAAELQASRVFRQSTVSAQRGFDVEGRRFLASFTGVTPPEGQSDIVVNVFVNCPYLSPATSYTDPHYAGTFSFFGRTQHHGGDFLIDITQPVRRLAREGRISEDKLRVQLMPLPAAAGAKSESTFQAGKVDILSV